jgi:hypothetical protein
VVVLGLQLEARAFILPVAVLFPVEQTPALAAEFGVVALGDRVAGVEALETCDVAGVADRWRLADGGQVAYRVASLAVVAVRTWHRETLTLEVGIAVLLELALLLLETVLLPVLSLLLLRLLLRLLRLKLLLLIVVLVVLVVLAVAIVLASRVPLIRLVTTHPVDMGVFVHITLLIGLGVIRVDLGAIADLRAIVGAGVVVVVAGITITIRIRICVAILV